MNELLFHTRFISLLTLVAVYYKSQNGATRVRLKSKSQTRVTNSWG